MAQVIVFYVLLERQVVHTSPIFVTTLLASRDSLKTLARVVLVHSEATHLKITHNQFAAPAKMENFKIYNSKRFAKHARLAFKT